MLYRPLLLIVSSVTGATKICILQRECITWIYQKYEQVQNLKKCKNFVPIHNSLMHYSVKKFRVKLVKGLIHAWIQKQNEGLKINVSETSIFIDLHRILSRFRINNKLKWCFYFLLRRILIYQYFSFFKK